MLKVFVSLHLRKRPQNSSKVLVSDAVAVAVFDVVEVWVVVAVGRVGGVGVGSNELPQGNCSPLNKSAKRLFAGG